MSTSTTEPGLVPPPLTPSITPQEARQLARKSGLAQMGVRPALPAYVRSVAERWQFIHVMARSRAYAANRASYLGQLWSVLNPTLNALVYTLIFGLLMGTRKGVDNIIAFIVIGTFMWAAFNHTVMGGARAIDSNIGLVRTMRFPRAVLPIASALAQFWLFLPSVAVMIVISWLSGFLPKFGAVPITWRWLLLPVALALFLVFNVGVALLFARISAGNPDIVNVLPFVIRLLMYVSGVLFSIPSLVPYPSLAFILQHQPASVFLDLGRMCLLAEESAIPWDPTMWAWGAGWAALFLGVGFLAFWQKEERYGRD